MNSSAAEAGGALAELAQRVTQTLSRLHQAREVSVGCSPKRALYSRGKTTLYEYLPAVGRPVARGAIKPVLICFALVNRPYILDLQPDRSLVRRLLEQGLSVYLIDWGTPDDSDRHTDFEDYIEVHLAGCVRHILRTTGCASLNLLGVCQGGVLSLCFTALHAEQIANLITITTAVDFHTPANLLSRWIRGLDTDLIAGCGNVPGEVLNGLFLALMPFRLTQEKYVRLLTGRPDQRAVEDFVRMERWIFDSPPQAAAALGQFVRWFYQENALARGKLRIRGKSVDLSRIRQPLLNLYALQDHIVPPDACESLGRYVGSRDYTACAVQTGHIGMYVSRAASEQIPQQIASWLKKRS